MRTKVALAGFSAVTALLVGCGDGQAVKSPAPETVSGLQIERVQLRNVPDELEAPGNVIASNTAQVAARTMGTVVRVAVREGDSVQRGQLLAQLDERELSARRDATVAAAQAADAGVDQAAKAVAAAQAQADVAQKTYERYQYLKEQRSVSPQEFDEISAKHQATQASLEQAKAALLQAQAARQQAQSEVHAAESVSSYARVVAAFDGCVTRRSIEPGSLVTPGTPLFVVEDTSHYQLEVSAPSEALLAVKKGTNVRVALDETEQKSLSGKVSEVEAGADPASHTVKARIDLPRAPGVQSGVFGRAFFSRGETKGITVPQSALVTRGQLRGVYFVDSNGLIHWRVLTFGKQFGDRLEVLSGLAEGDSLILNPGPQELDGKKAGDGGKRP